MCLVGCGGTTATYDLSNHFIAKEIGRSFSWKAHVELYVREPNGTLTFIGATRDPKWPEQFPWGFKGLESKYVAVSEDGASLVYAHNFGPPEKKAYGVYFRRYNEPERLLLEGYIGAINRGKPLPDYVVAMGTQGVTTEGEIVELALLESTPLHEAALAGDVERIEALVREGHDLHAANYWGYEPLELALVHRHEAAAVRLIEHGAHDSPRSAVFLCLVAAYKLPEAVRALLERGIPATASTPEGLTPVHSAVSLPWITSHGAVIGAPVPREYGSILPKAVEVLRIVLAHGGDPNAQLEDGTSALERVATPNYYWWNQQDHPELREELRSMLIEAGARP